MNEKTQKSEQKLLDTISDTQKYFTWHPDTPPEDGSHS